MAARKPETPTLFGRLRRFRWSPDRNPREDRLTEALAATLEACPAVASAIVSAWFGLDASGALTVTTQRKVTPSERIDLELLFGPPGNPELRIWFEAKVDDQPTSAQIQRYRDVLIEMPGASRLTWLIPAGLTPPAGWPDGVHEHTWQRLATTLDHWFTTLDQGEAERYGPRLVVEFVRHLEEEGLAVTQPLTAADADALNMYPAAKARLIEILSTAGAEIVRTRPHKDGALWSPRSSSFWQVVEGGDQHSRRTVYQWFGDLDRHRSEPTGEWVIGVGASWKVADAPSSRDSEWLARRALEDFELSAPRRGEIHLFRYQTLSSLSKPPTLGEQASALSGWAQSTWDLLDADPL